MLGPATTNCAFASAGRTILATAAGMIPWSTCQYRILCPRRRRILGMKSITTTTRFTPRLPIGGARQGRCHRRHRRQRHRHHTRPLFSGELLEGEERRG